MTVHASKSTITVSIGLGFVAGYVDTLGFVALFGLFTAHVTGNFVLIGATLAHSSGTILLKLLVFPAFVLAVALARLTALWLERRKQPVMRPLLLLQFVLLVAFACAGWVAMPIEQPDSTWAIWAGVLGAGAMGVQNAAARLALPTMAPTTVMTGNVTQLVIDVVDLLRGGAGDAIRQRGIGLIVPIIAFAAGAIGGAFGYEYVGFAALLVPMGIVGWLALAS